MSVYKPSKGRFFHYDFVYQRRRYSGSTGATTRAKAERVEEARRLAAARGELDRPKRAIPTLGQAATTWWLSKAHLKTAAELQRRADDACGLVGRDKPVNEVTFSDLRLAIQKRRGQLTASKRPPANATVNRDLIATLRPIIALADELLNDGKGDPTPFPTIKWGKLRLPEPRPQPRGLTGVDLAQLVEALPPALQDFARFQARYGCRLAEMFFPLADLDLDAGRVTLRCRKGGDAHVIPLLPEDVAMLATRVGRARAAKIDSPWFREPAPGRLVALSYPTANTARRLAMTTTGLRERKGMRGSHNLRHTAGMDMLRATGNLRAAQRLLGHASIQSTLVYAHVLEDDLRQALAQVSRPAPEPASGREAETEDKPLIANEKA